MVDVEEDIVTQIYGAPYLNYYLASPNFLPCRHGWKFSLSAVLVDLLQSSLICFTPCDLASVIIAMASSSSSEVFLVTTLIILGNWGGWGDLCDRVYGGVVSLATPFLGLRWWKWLDFGIIINSTLCNQFLRRSRGIQVENSEVDQWRGTWYPTLFVSVCCPPLPEIHSWSYLDELRGRRCGGGRWPLIVIDNDEGII